MDRYAYVNNSPVNYTDPSGYKCEGKINSNDIPILDDDCEMQPDYIPPEELSDEVTGLGISEADLYQTYLKLWSNKSAWYWKSGHFTLADFISIILLKEGGSILFPGTIDFKNYQEAFGRSFNRWCNANVSCQYPSSASALKFLAYYSASAAGIVSNPSETMLPTSWDIPVMYPIINAIYNPDFRIGCLNNRPCDWADLNLLRIRQGAKAVRKATSNPWFSTFIDPFYILTPCQAEYWYGGYWAEGGVKNFLSTDVAKKMGCTY